MPSTPDPRPDPGREPGIEARLRAELGQGSLPEHVRQRHLTRLHAIAAELGPATSENGDGAHAAEGDGASPAPVLGPTRPFRVDRDTVPPAQDGATPLGQDGATPADDGTTTAPAFSHPSPDGGPAAQRARRRWFAAKAPRAAAASVMAFAVMVGGGGTAVAASADALPGEALHHVKRAVEQVRVATAWAPSSEVEAHLGVAETRLEEAERLIAGDGELAELPATLDRHEAALDAAAEHADDDPALAASVDEATGRATARLAELREELPDTAAPQARDALERAGERLEQRLPGDGEGRPEAPGTSGDQPDAEQPPAGQRGLTPPDRPSGQDPATAPEREQAPEDAGQPEDPGQPDDPGRSEGRASEDAGQPEETGQRDDAGSSDGGQSEGDGQPDGGAESEGEGSSENNAPSEDDSPQQNDGGHDDARDTSSDPEREGPAESDSEGSEPASDSGGAASDQTESNEFDDAVDPTSSTTSDAGTGDSRPSDNEESGNGAGP